MDRHLTFAEHVQNVVTKCHGLLGVLRRAAPYLPQKLLKLAYIALVRTHLEYCSCLFASIAKTHSNKLEVVQKIAARIVCQAPHDAHSAPLLLELGLKSLEQRRVDHICRVVSQCLQGQCHPALMNRFSADAEGFVIQSSQPSTAPGKKRFTYTAVNLFNRSRIKSGSDSGLPPSTADERVSTGWLSTAPTLSGRDVPTTAVSTPPLLFRSSATLAL